VHQVAVLHVPRCQLLLARLLEAQVLPRVAHTVLTRAAAAEAAAAAAAASRDTPECMSYSRSARLRSHRQRCQVHSRQQVTQSTNQTASNSMLRLSALEQGPSTLEVCG
jgi:hypothetical protein